MGDNSFLIKLGLDTQKLLEGVNRGNSILDNFSGKVMNVATTLGVAFSVQQVTSFATELIKLAGVADGVKQAFNKIANSAKVLEEMKQATRGTVTELNLMKSAVQAGNFGIPIEQLGTLFQFAYERAKATGQSVDYLVNSIVTGIGRKSPLILDNLGISAVQLKEKLGGVSTEAASIGQIAEAVGKIAKQSLDEMGESSVTAAEKIAKIETNWENFKERAGTGLAFLFDPLLEGLNKLTGGGNKALGELESMVAEFGRTGSVFDNLSTIQKKADEAGVSLLTWAESAIKAEREGSYFKETLKDLIETLKLLTPDKTPPPALVHQLGMIELINQEMKRLTEEKNKAFDWAHIARYNKQLESLKKTLEAINKVGLEPEKRPKPGFLGIGSGLTYVTPSIQEMIKNMGKGGGEAGPGKGADTIHQTTINMIKLQERVDKLSHALKVGLTDAFVSAGEAMGQYFAGADVNVGAVGLDAIGSMAVQLGGVLIAQGIAVEAFKESLASLNGYAAIAAGIALVAAGSAFKATAANIASSGSGARGGGASAPIARPADQIELRGQFRIDGADLVYIIDKQGHRQSVVGG